MTDAMLATAAMLILAACVPTADAPGARDTIPPALHGDWGLSARDCEGGALAKGLLRVGARELGFYESRATLGEIRSRDEDGIRARFAFAGEGESWSRDMTLALQGRDGQTLRRITHDGSPATDGPGPLDYRRCP